MRRTRRRRRGRGTSRSPSRSRVGIVSASRPLAVLAAGEEQVVERAAGHPFGVVLVPSFADPVLVGDEEDLRAAFGTPVDVSPFTADDLWFCTI
ncbi:hypothetical protein [Actinoplanes sp. NPDC023714]|uniref:hypothetical protein n=1 Tax=Actinoplanes sp. NPDC023714 TaxID=3154322 RepID=UPI0033EF7157